MKNILSDNPILCFTLFALLIASRDTVTQIFLSEHYHPLVIIFIFFLVTTIFALGYRIIVKKDFQWIKSSSENFKTKISLGFITFFVFLLTVFGIKFLGAPIFSLIEHCLIPISTLIIAHKYLEERISLLMKLGIIISIGSVILFMISSTNINLTFLQQTYWYLGILCAVLGSILTSMSSAFQKKLVNQNLRPDEILLIRFIVPTLLTGIIIYIKQYELPETLLFTKIAINGFLFFTLPLVLLFQGFVRASLGRFSPFNILVPVFTFIIASIFLSKEIDKWSNPLIIVSILGITSGYIVFEWDSIKKVIKS